MAQSINIIPSVTFMRCQCSRADKMRNATHSNKVLRASDCEVGVQLHSTKLL